VSVVQQQCPYVLLCVADTSATAWEQQEVSSNQFQ